MASEGHPEAKLQEEIDLLRRKLWTPEAPATSPKQEKQRRPYYSCFRRWWRPLALLDDVLRRRSRCVVCLQVHQVSGLPPCMDGLVLAVGWRTRGWKGELTLPAHVRGGSAQFDEIFLHYRNADLPSTLQGFTVWVSLVDAGDCDLGTFDVDLERLVPAESATRDSMFGGTTVCLDLWGMAEGGVLKLSVYHRVIEGQLHELRKQRFDIDHGAGRKVQGDARCGCFPLRARRTRSLTVSARRMPSCKSDVGCVAVENIMGDSFTTDEEDEGYITMEKGMVPRRARSSRRPPSNNSFDLVVDDDVDDDNDRVGAAERFFKQVAVDDCDVDEVEDEFLKMLEKKAREKQDRRGGSELEKDDEESLRLNLIDLSFDVDAMDMEVLMMAADMGLNKAARVWMGEGNRGGGAALEREEHEELMKRWGAAATRGETSPRSSPSRFAGFGSPFYLAS